MFIYTKKCLSCVRAEKIWLEVKVRTHVHTLTHDLLWPKKLCDTITRDRQIAIMRQNLYLHRTNGISTIVFL